jgi:phage anti-repressor protein
MSILSDEVMGEIKTVFLSITQNNRNGCFISIYDTIKWLGLDSNKLINVTLLIKNIKKRYLKNEDYYFIEVDDESHDGDFCIIREGHKKVPYFSDEGFKKFCMIYPNPKSNLVRMYYIKLEKEFITALNATEADNKKSLDDLSLKTAEMKKKYDTMKSSLLLSQNDAENERSIRIKYEETMFYQNSLLQKQHEFSDFVKQEEYTGDDDYKIYKIIKKKFFKPSCVYIVSCDYINDKYKSGSCKRQKNKLSRAISCHNINDIKKESCKNIGKSNNVDLILDSSSDSDDDNKKRHKRVSAIQSHKLDYDYLNVNINDFSDDIEKNETYYFMISAFNTNNKPRKLSKSLTSIYFMDKDHYSEFTECIKREKEYATPIKNIFAMSFSDIINFKNRILINKYKKMKK